MKTHIYKKGDAAFAALNYYLREQDYIEASGTNAQLAKLGREFARIHLALFPWLDKKRCAIGREEDGTIRMDVFETKAEFYDALKKWAEVEKASPFAIFSDNHENSKYTVLGPDIEKKARKR